MHGCCIGRVFRWEMGRDSDFINVRVRVCVCVCGSLELSDYMYKRLWQVCSSACRVLSAV